MGRKVLTSDKDKAVELYLADHSAKEAARIVGLNVKTLLRTLTERGIPRHRGRPLEGVLERYRRGDSVLALARRYGVSRGVIDRRLRAAGVEKRSASEQNTISAARQTKAERLTRAAAAHRAKRGRAPRESTLTRAAATRERRARVESEGERRMLLWLEKRFEVVGIQTAVKRYNVDFTIPPLAVELLGGEWHARKRRHARRTKAILDAGWHLLFAWDTPTYPIERAAADYAVAFAEEIGKNPAAVSEYRVIRGDGELVARGSLENYDLTLIPAARSGMSASEAGRLGAATRWHPNG